MPTPATEVPKDPIGFLDFYLVKKAPVQIPEGGREWIVKFGPWITVVLLIFTLPVLLVALGIGTFLMPFGGIGYAAGFGILTSCFRSARSITNKKPNRSSEDQKNFYSKLLIS